MSTQSAQRMTTSWGYEMARVRAGTYTVPARSYTVGRPEGKLHQVIITRDYWMGVTPVTQAQYQA